MHRYMEMVGAITVEVEFDILESPKLATGSVNLHIQDPLLKKLAYDIHKKPITFEFHAGRTNADSKLQIQVHPYWHEEQWSQPVMSRLTLIILNALDAVGIIPGTSTI